MKMDKKAKWLKIAKDQRELPKEILRAARKLKKLGIKVERRDSSIVAKP